MDGKKARQIQQAAYLAWDTGQLGKEFSAKQLERDIHDIDIQRTLRSKSTLICRYTDHRQPRYGFWHPRIKIWLAWQPAEEGQRSEFKSCSEMDWRMVNVETTLSSSVSLKGDDDEKTENRETIIKVAQAKLARV